MSDQRIMRSPRRAFMLLFGGIAVVAICLLLLHSFEVNQDGMNVEQEILDCLAIDTIPARHRLFDEMVDRGTQGDSYLRAIIASLKSQHVEVRAFVVKVLGRIGSRSSPAVPGLKAIVLDETERRDVRASASSTLGSIGHPALDCLQSFLCHPDPTIRAWGADALSRSSPEDHHKSIAALLDALADSDDSVRAVASDTLELFGAKAVPFLTRTATGSRNLLQSLGALLVLAKMDALGNVPFERILQAGVVHQDVAIRLHAFDVIEELNLIQDYLTSICAALTSDSAQVRTVAASLLAQIENTAEIGQRYLLPALDDEDETARTHAIHALARSKVQASLLVPALVRKLGDESQLVRETAVEALGAMGAKARTALPSLHNALDGDAISKDLLHRAIARIKRH